MTETYTMKVFIWRNPRRGEVATMARTEKQARQKIQKQNPAFAALLSGEPLVLDPNDKNAIVFRWRRY